MLNIVKIHTHIRSTKNTKQKLKKLSKAETLFGLFQYSKVLNASILKEKSNSLYFPAILNSVQWWWFAFEPEISIKLMILPKIRFLFI